MDEKSKTIPFTGIKPLRMKLFATWEVDKTPSNCIPRLCTLTLSRLVLFKKFGSDISSILLAVKMQGSKRILRSNEMTLPANDLLDTELQLTFSLQYPHFLKKDGNQLLVMLQRHKRYKHRTIFGYKTLAHGIINMAQVLQKPMALELDLISDTKEDKGSSDIAARVTVSALNSQPVDCDDSTKSIQHFPTVTDFSDIEEEFSSNDEGSDSKAMLESRRMKKDHSIAPRTVRQRNLKQKIMSLLKRFKINEDLHGLEDNDRELIKKKLTEREIDHAEISDLFEEIDLSDSAQEVDTISISSTPKPSLRPYFSSNRSLDKDRYEVQRL